MRDRLRTRLFPKKQLEKLKHCLNTDPARRARGSQLFVTPVPCKSKTVAVPVRGLLGPKSNLSDTDNWFRARLNPNMLGNERGGGHHIVIHEEQAFSRRCLCPHIARSPLPSVWLQIKSQLKRHIEVFQILSRAIGGSVDDHDDLELVRFARLMAKCINAIPQFIQPVISGYDDAELIHLFPVPSQFGMAKVPIQ